MPPFQQNYTSSIFSGMTQRPQKHPKKKIYIYIYINLSPQNIEASNDKHTF